MTKSNDSPRDQKNRKTPTETGQGERSFPRRNLLKAGGLAALGLPLFTPSAKAHHQDDSDLVLKSNPRGESVIHLDAGSSSAVSGVRIYADGRNGNLFLGGNGAEGDLALRNGRGDNRIHLDSSGDNLGDSPARIYADGRRGNIWLGGNGADGDVVLKSDAGKEYIHFDASDGDAVSESRIWLNGQDGSMRLGGGESGTSGSLGLVDRDRKLRLQLTANDGVVIAVGKNPDDRVAINPNKNGGDVYLGALDGWLSEIVG